MTLEDLDDDQLLVLVAVLRELVKVDDVVTFVELARMRQLKARIGSERWHRLIDEAVQALPDLGAMEAAGRAIEDHAVKGFILAQARELAAADGLGPEEELLLDRLARAWERPATGLAALLDAVARDREQVGRATEHLRNRGAFDDEQEVQFLEAEGLSGRAKVRRPPISLSMGSQVEVLRWADGAFRWSWKAAEAAKHPKLQELRQTLAAVPELPAGLLDADEVTASDDEAWAVGAWLAWKHGLLPHRQQGEDGSLTARGVMLDFHDGVGFLSTTEVASWCSCCGSSRFRRDTLVVDGLYTGMCNQCIGLFIDAQAAGSFPEGRGETAVVDPEQPPCLVCMRRPPRLYGPRMAICEPCTIRLAEIAGVRPLGGGR